MLSRLLATNSLICVGLVAVCVATPQARAAEGKQGDAATAEGISFFEKHIRPLLVERCYECHSQRADEGSGGLLLDSREGMQVGGDSGPALVPGKPHASRLIRAVRYSDSDLQMPPDGRLSKAEITALEHWVKIGAPDPRDGSAPRRSQPEIDLESGRQHWAFRAVAKPPLPPVQAPQWARAPLDRFVLARLEAAGIEPPAPADKRTLIRRATFDLTGLPPTPAEIDAFLADESPDAFVKAIDRLLASPAYGERWGRHWLDVARYADSNGLDENLAYGTAWRYRDYVIAAFNCDKPYDRFVREQLAGDLLPAENRRERHEQLIATGFLSLGPKVLAEVDERKMEMDIVDEQISTVGTAFLGLTLGCARCHDHKFDPLRQKDYYALAGIFKSTKTMENFTKIARWHENEIPSAAEKQELREHAEQVEQLQARIEALSTARKQDRGESREAGEIQEGRSKEKQKEAPAQQTEDQVEKLRDELTRLKLARPALPTAIGVTRGEAADVPIHVRGSHLNLGEAVPRGFPAVLCSDGAPAIPPDRSGRLQLARWLTSDRHPLTARVMVNRIWQGHFGRGLAETPDNFGTRGKPPTHPALLDWLANRFVESGWSIKAMHRQIMLSATYQASSDHVPEAAAIDPQNRLLWRQNPRRLEAEALRDSLLAVSGALDRRMGGSMLNVENREFIFNHTSQDNTSYDSRRRSIYLPVVRNHLYDIFSLFDYPDPAVPSGKRATSTVAPQALFLLNSETVTTASERLGRRLEREGDSEDAKIEALYEIALGRKPTATEVQRSAEFLANVHEQLGKEGVDESERPQQAWQALVQVVLLSSEFVYVR